MIIRTLRTLALTVAGPVLAALWMIPSPAHAGPVSVDAGVDAYSQYVWRGFVLADTLVVQPSTTAAIADTGLSIGLWGSMALTDRDKYEVTDELDIIATFEHGFTLGEQALTASVSFVEYMFPNGADDATHTEEVIVALALDTWLAPNVLAAYDFGLNDGTYLAAGIAPSMPLVSIVSLSLSAMVGFGDVGQSMGFQDATVTGAVPLQLGPVTVSPMVGYAYASDDINPDSDVFWGGVSVGL